MKKIIALLLALFLMCASSALLASCDEKKDEGGDTSKPADTTTEPEETTEPEQTTEPLTEEQIFMAALEDGVKRTGELENVNLKITMTMSMKTDGAEAEVPMDILLKMKDIDGDDPELYAKISMNAVGVEMEMESYYKDGWTYTLENGVGTKEKTELGGSDDAVTDVVPFLPSISDTLEMEHKDIDFLEQFDGSKQITMSFTGEKYEEYFSELVESMTGS